MVALALLEQTRTDGFFWKNAFCFGQKRIRFFFKEEGRRATRIYIPRSLCGAPSVVEGGAGVSGVLRLVDLEALVQRWTQLLAQEPGKQSIRF